MTTSALALSYRSGVGGCQVYRYANGGMTAIGDEFDTAYAVTTLPAMGNRVIQVEGELFALGRNGIYKKKDPTTDVGGWDLLGSAWTGHQNINDSGLFLHEEAGVPTLIWIAGTSTAYRYLLYKMPLVRPYTPVSLVDPYLDLTAAAALYGCCASTHRDGVIYMGGSIPSGSGICLKFDVLNAVSSYQIETTNISNYGLGYNTCVVNGRTLWLISTASGGKKIYEDWATFRVSVGGNPNTATHSNLIFWPNSGNDFYVFSWDANTNWKVFKITLDVWVATDITTTVLPEGVRVPGHGNGRVFAIADRTTNPGVTEWVLAFGSASAITNPMLFYKWNSDTTLIEPVPFNASGGQIGHALALEHPVAAGQYHYIPGEVDISIKSRTAVLGGMVVTFVGHGDPIVISHGGTTSPGGITDWVEGETVTGGTSGAQATLIRRDPNGDDSAFHVGGVTNGPFVAGESISGTTGTAIISGTPIGGAANKVAKIFFIDSNGNLAQGTLAGNATGGTAVRVGNEVQNIIADGVTEYSVLWAFQVDGISIGQQVGTVMSLTN